MRVVIQSGSMGTLLDYAAFFGWALFSRQPSDRVDEQRAKQTAITFADVNEAQAFIKRIGGVMEADVEESERFPTDLTFVEVDTAEKYAPMSACVAAGVPAWHATGK